MKKTRGKIDIDTLLNDFVSYCEKEQFVVGKLNDGRIYARRNNGDKKIYVSTGIHGDEPAGPITVTLMMKASMFPQNADVLIFPCLNVDGFRKGTRSDHGFDLNRDFKLQKSNKTKSQKQIIEEFGIPDMSIMLHEDWESNGFYIYDQCDDISRADDIINTVSKFFPIDSHKRIDKHDVSKPGIITPIKLKSNRKKWPEAIWLWNIGCPENYTIETPSGQPIKNRVLAQIKACQTVM